MLQDFLFIRILPPVPDAMNHDFVVKLNGMERRAGNVRLWISVRPTCQPNSK